MLAHSALNRFSGLSCWLTYVCVARGCKKWVKHPGASRYRFRFVEFSFCLDPAVKQEGTSEERVTIKRENENGTENTFSPKREQPDRVDEVGEVFFFNLVKLVSLSFWSAGWFS